MSYMFRAVPVLVYLGALLPACIVAPTPAARGDAPAASYTRRSTSVPSAAVTPAPTYTPAPINSAVTSDVTPEPSRAAGNADVQFVRAAQSANGDWTFRVTVSHPDTGWEDYADGWDVVTPDGKVLKPDSDSQFTRALLHPHEEEQPFTRSQTGVYVPDGVTVVRVRAHDLVDGFGGREVVVDLNANSGPNFEVEHRP